MIVSTSGINYDTPKEEIYLERGKLVKLKSLIKKEEDISTLHLDLNVDAEFNGNIINMHSSTQACGSGCRRKFIEFYENGEIKNLVEILRFAKSGRSAYKPNGLHGLLIKLYNLSTIILSPITKQYRPFGIDWLVTMEDGYNLKGSITKGVNNQKSINGTLTLGGRMIITYQTNNDKAPIILKSRKEPILSGKVDCWPPRNAIIHLTNGPIEYFKEDEVYNREAKPVLKIIKNSVTFSNDEVKLLSTTAHIKAAKILKEGKNINGVQLTWSIPKSEIEPSSCSIEYSNIYRKYDNKKTSEGNEWIKIATVPKNISEWIDSNYDGSQDAKYAVLHASKLKFNYYYESLIGTILSIPKSK